MNKFSSVLLWQMTPASSVWSQLWLPTPMLGQNTSRVSLPEHSTLSSQIGPVPRPKKENEEVTAPAMNVVTVRNRQTIYILGVFVMWVIPCQINTKKILTPTDLNKNWYLLHFDLCYLKNDQFFSKCCFGPFLQVL